MGPLLRLCRRPREVTLRGPRSDQSPDSERITARSVGRRGLSLALAAVLGVGLSVSLGACKNAPDLALDYGQTALENYELALGEFEDRDWEEAISYADFVRIRFPFSRFAVEAELLVARSEFEQGNYAISQDSFKQFGRLHPTHHHVRNGWIAYMAAVSAFMNAPDGVGIMPPYYQRDQTGLRDALGELSYFFDHYTGSEMEPLAVELRNEVNRRLLRHELYVARFYLDRNRPEAAIGRLETAHDDFPGIGLDAEVLFLLGLTYMKMDEIELSRSTFAELQAQHPQHHHGKQARLYLKYLYDTYGPADPNRVRPDRSPPTPVPPARPKNPRKASKPNEGPEPEELAPEPTPEKTKFIPAQTTPPAESSSAEASPAASGASATGSKTGSKTGAAIKTRSGDEISPAAEGKAESSDPESSDPESSEASEASETAADGTGQ